MQFLLNKLRFYFYITTFPFDIYSGANIDDGKKSVALSVSIQDDNKTLEEADIEKINKTIIDGIVQKFGAVLRDS